MHLPRHPDPLLPIDPALPRRQWLGRALGLLSAAALAGCASPWPPVPAGTGSSCALQRLRDSAAAHGAAAWAGLGDVALAVDPSWTPTGGLAGPAQWRWLPAAGVMAAQTTTPTGRLAQWRRKGAASEQRVWRDAVPVTDTATLAAAAAQADLLQLLWRGPAAVADNPGVVNWAEPQTLDGRRCDHLHLSGVPGLLDAAPGRLSLFIDREQGWLRRLQVSIDGADGGSGLVELDLTDHRRLHGVLWPLRCQVKRPLVSLGSSPLVWRLTALDVNRGLQPEHIAGPLWSGPANQPAQALG
jgi:hypothetical protein